MTSTAVAVDESAQTTTGETVYLVAWRNSSTGALQVYKQSDGTWGTFSGAQWANYDIAATELTGSGIYAVSVPTAIAVHGSIYTFEWRVQAGGSPALTDVVFDRYDVAFDGMLQRFVPPTQIVGQSRLFSVNVDQIGHQGIADSMGVGSAASGMAEFDPVVPSNVTESLGIWTFGSSSTDQLVRDTQTITPGYGTLCTFKLSTGAAGTNTYIGLFADPADEDDISASLIDPSETASSKAGMRAGFIIRADAAFQTVFILTGTYNAVADTAGRILPAVAATYSVALKPSGDLVLYDGAGNTLASIAGTYTAGVDNTCAWGFVCNTGSSGTISNVVVGGKGYRSNTTPTAAEISTEVDVAAALTAQGLTTTRAAKLDNLDGAVSDIVAGTTQPRINYRAGRAYQLKISSTADGTYKATKPVKLRPGVIAGDGIAVSVDMSPLYGEGVFVSNVGTPAVSGGSLTSTAAGPRDTEAMILIDGTATAGEDRTITFDVTMDTGGGGETVPVTIDVEVFAE